jgi:hypothetical protein
VNHLNQTAQLHSRKLAAILPNHRRQPFNKSWKQIQFNQKASLIIISEAF